MKQRVCMLYVESFWKSQSSFSQNMISFSESKADTTDHSLDCGDLLKRTKDRISKRSLTQNSKETLQNFQYLSVQSIQSHVRYLTAEKSYFGRISVENMANDLNIKRIIVTLSQHGQQTRDVRTTKHVDHIISSEFCWSLFVHRQRNEICTHFALQ